MSDFQFRPAEAADLPALHTLIERAYRGESAKAGWTHEADLIEGPRTDMATLAAILADPNALLVLALREGTVVGCVQITRCSPAVSYLGLLAVDPVLQSAGLGRQLLTTAEQEAVRRFGASRTELTVISVRAELIAYYERRGYALTGERRPFPIALDPPLTLVVLEKAVAPNA